MTDRDLDNGLADIRAALKTLWEVNPNGAAKVLAKLQRAAWAVAPDFTHDEQH